MDDELSRNAQKLIDVAMAEDLPPPAIADGSWEIVVSRLTLEAAAAEAAQAEPSPAVAAPGVQPRAQPRNWVGVAVIALALLAAGGLLWLVAQPRPIIVPETAPPPTPPPAKASKAAPAEVAAPAPAATPVDPARLLDEAASAEPARALELLAEHAQLAPLGAGAERRMALRISALCALGRTDDARAEARAFLGQPRDAEWTAHVRSSCASN